MSETMQGSLSKLPVRDLLVGMYIARLDRPWAGTPFPPQGFHIRHSDDIQKLRVQCNYVFVDTRRSRSVAKSATVGDAPAPEARSRESDVYDKDRVPFAAEIGNARRYYRAVSLLLVDCYEQLYGQQEIPYLSLRRVAVNIVDGICRNPDAYAWAARVYDQESYYSRAAVRAAIWAVSTGRNLGLPRDQLLMLLLGCVLADVGRTRLPEILHDDAAQDVATIAPHVELGVELLQNTVGMDDEVLTIVRAHHERHDGAGYPSGLKKDKIPLLARLSGIADHYETITNPQPCREEPLSPADAMSELYELRGVKFMGQIVGEFVRTLGVYPVGSLVELSSGDIAIVQRQHVERRLKPVVMRVLKRNGGRYHWKRMLDLREEEQKAHRHPVEIATSLPHGAYGFDPRTLVRKPIFGF